MTNISRHKLSQEHEQMLFNQMNNLVAKLNKSSARLFFDDLLGPEEKIMLIKRLAAVFMYIEQNSSYRVWKELKLSPSTAEKIKSDFDNGRYDNIICFASKNKSDYQNFWKTMEVVLRAGLPEQGKNRWKTGFGKDFN